MKNIDVCFSPLLLDNYIQDNQTIVVVDVLRATSSIVMALENGAKSVIPVVSREEAKIYKERGCFVAGEKGGVKLPYADIGNSPSFFSKDVVEGEEIYFRTTNGTKTIHQAAAKSSSVLIGAFYNRKALADFLLKQPSSVLVLCAGYRDKFNIEDTLFAGALAEELQKENAFSVKNDATLAALDLWQLANENNLLDYAQKIEHKERLAQQNIFGSIEECFRLDVSSAIPQFKNDIAKIVLAN